MGMHNSIVNGIKRLSLARCSHSGRIVNRDKFRWLAKPIFEVNRNNCYAERRGILDDGHVPAALARVVNRYTSVSVLALALKTNI